jgi:hypothetical protein
MEQEGVVSPANHAGKRAPSRSATDGPKNGLRDLNTTRPAISSNSRSAIN